MTSSQTTLNYFFTIYTRIDHLGWSFKVALLTSDQKHNQAFYRNLIIILFPIGSRFQELHDYTLQTRYINAQRISLA